MTEPFIVCDCGLELLTDEKPDRHSVTPAIIRKAKCPECGRIHWHFVPQFSNEQELPKDRT